VALRLLNMDGFRPASVAGVRAAICEPLIAAIWAALKVVTGGLVVLAARTAVLVVLVAAELTSLKVPSGMSINIAMGILPFQIWLSKALAAGACAFVSRADGVVSDVTI
jgi:hypothetical protein